MNHLSASILEHKPSVHEDFQRLLRACRAEPWDEAGLRQLAGTLSTKWGLVSAAPAAAGEPIDSAPLIERIDSLLGWMEKPATQAAAGETAENEVLPAVQWEVLLERCQGDIAFCRKLLQMFTCRVVDQLAAVEQAAHAGDMPALARKAHAAKSVAATLAADAICRGAAELEELGRRGDAAAVDAALQRFRGEVDCCLEYIPRLLATVAAANHDARHSKLIP